jgi:hypothetical protein
MPNSHLHRLSQPPNVLLQDLNGDAVLLNLSNGQYYGLDENSYHMYKALLAGESVQAAYESLLGEYEVEPSRLKKDLDQFLVHLLENGLLVDDNDRPE